MAASRKAQKEATRRELKAAAMRVFGSVGFDDASVGRITREAGVAHGTFYVHFETKDALLDELLEDFNRDIAEALTPIWAGVRGQPLEQTIRRTAEVFLDFWYDRRAFIDAFARRSLVRPDVEQLTRGFSPGLAVLLTTGLSQMAAFSNASLPCPEVVAHGLLGMWLRIVLQYVFNPDISRPETLTALCAMTKGALLALVPGLEATAEEKT